MSKLTAQTPAGATKPAHAVIQWPTFNPPPPHPVFGVTAAHLDYMSKWYSSVQGAVNGRMDAQSAAIEATNTALATANETIASLQTQLKSTTKT
jgi:hypothetical protein